MFSTLSVFVISVLLTGIGGQLQVTGRQVWRRAEDTATTLVATRLADVQARLDRLEDAVNDAEMTSLLLGDHHRITERIGTRINRLFGEGCDAEHFQCAGEAGDRPHCIHRHLVCDGSPDCYNGHDEQDDICASPSITEGSVWTARADWTGCVCHKFTTSLLLVTFSERSAHLPSIVHLKMTYLVDIENKDDGTKTVLNVPTVGIYWFGGRNLTVYPASAQDVGATCIFDNSHRCLGHVYDPNSGENCGHFTLARLLTK